MNCKTIWTRCMGGFLLAIVPFATCLAEGDRKRLPRESTSSPFSAEEPTIPRRIQTGAPDSASSMVVPRVSRIRNTGFATTPSASATQAAKTRAEQDWKSLWQNLSSKFQFLFIDGKPRFREWVGGPKATVWPHSQALAAGLDLKI